MQVAINPKDTNTFASASLDHTIKIWSIGTTSTSSNYSLIGHTQGVNCVNYCQSGDKPFIVSGGDDGFVKIWDYQTKACLVTFDAHQDNVTDVAFHPDLPLIFSAGEDNHIKIYNTITFRQEEDLDYNYERVWSINTLADGNLIAFGTDQATVVVKVG